MPAVKHIPDMTLRESLRSLQGERAIPFGALLESIEAALISAFKNTYGKEQLCVVDMDRESGEYLVYHRRAVVAFAEHPFQISLGDVPGKYKPGDFYDVPVSPRTFGRIGAMAAKQTIIGTIRSSERDALFNQYSEQQFALIGGTVQRYEGGSMLVDLGDTEAVMPSREQVSRETHRIGDRILTFVLLVRKTNRGPQIILSRAAPFFVQRLFEREVPEIEDGTVEIMGIAREAGQRSKIAVQSHNPDVDAVGACLGPKSRRAAAVSAELRGEKLDIIRWSADPVEYIKNALAPAKVLSVDIEDDLAVIVVPEYQVALAIGSSGQNVRLAAQLTGYRIDIFGGDVTHAPRRETTAQEKAVEPERPDPTVDADPEVLRKLQEFKRTMFG